MMRAGRRENRKPSEKGHGLFFYFSIVEFIVICALISVYTNGWYNCEADNGKINLPAPPVKCISSSQIASLESIQVPVAPKNDAVTQIEHEKCAGVAITLMLHSPKWFQRRYTVMVQNVMANIPTDWCIQIFYTGRGQSQNGLNINFGLQRLVSKQQHRFFLSRIPDDLQHKYKKKIEFMSHHWLWKTAKAERILIFGGNQAMCGNANFDVSRNYTSIDYIGTPWKNLRGEGGDGGISLRSRSAMLAAIAYQTEKGTPHNGREREDAFLMRALIEMKKEGHLIEGIRPVVVATREQTERFGGTSYFTKHFNSTVKSRNTETIGPPGVVSGTLPEMPFEVRDAFLTVCPELKMIFPSMHEPACFGAHPDPVGCKKSICALRDPPRKGGC